MTKQRDIRKRPRQSEEPFRVIFNSIDDGIIVHDVETGAFIDVNSRLCEMFGYRRDEMLQLDLGDLSASVSPLMIEDALRRPLRAASGRARPLQWLCKAKDDRQIWIEISQRRAHFGGRDVLVSTVRDVTEQERIEGALRNIETSSRTLSTRS